MDNRCSMACSRRPSRKEILQQSVDKSMRAGQAHCLVRAPHSRWACVDLEGSPELGLQSAGHLENTLSWALPAGSLDWFSCSPQKQPEAGSPSLAICLKHLVIRCKPHTGALKLKCAVTLPPTLAFVAAPGCPSLCQGEYFGVGN